MTAQQATDYSIQPRCDSPEKRAQREALLWDERLTDDEKIFFLMKARFDPLVPGHIAPRIYNLKWAQFAGVEQRRILRAIRRHCTSFFDIARFLDGHD